MIRRRCVNRGRDRYGSVAMDTGNRMTAFGLSHDAWGRLVLIDSDGNRHADVRPIRLFPHSDPDHWFALCDESGRELALVEDPAALPAAQRDMIVQELKRREFLPIITH